jgi:hypothetical protein
VSQNEPRAAISAIPVSRTDPDSVWSFVGDVPMTKVKVNANQEYQYITNFKVLQKAFKDHGIEKVNR